MKLFRWKVVLTNDETGTVKRYTVTAGTHEAAVWTAETRLLSEGFGRGGGFGVTSVTRGVELEVRERA